MYVNFTNTQRQILRLLNITEKYWFVEYKFGVFSINHAWKEGIAWLRVFFYVANIFISSKLQGFSFAVHTL